MTVRDDLTTTPDGGFGVRHQTVQLVQPKESDVEFGADPLPASELTLAVRDRLAIDPALTADVSRILVVRQGRALVLQGQVTSEEARQAAESVARGTPGVTEVNNLLVVDEA